MKDYHSKAGSARWANVTAAERSEIMRTAAKARWGGDGSEKEAVRLLRKIIAGQVGRGPLGPSLREIERELAKGDQHGTH